MVQVHMGTNKHCCGVHKLREYRLGNQKWIIQRNLQHRVHKTKTNTTKTQHNMCWTPPHAHKRK